MQTKHVSPLQFKETSTGGGYFEGLLSSYKHVDKGGDLVERGAYTVDLQRNGSTRPLLWQHNPAEPIGSLELSDQPDGLHVKGQLLLELPIAKQAYILIKNNIVKGLSIGYETVKKEFIDGVRHLKEITLYEGSIVTFPMSLQSTITAVKGFGGRPDLRQAEERIAEAKILEQIETMRRLLRAGLSNSRH